MGRDEFDAIAEAKFGVEEAELVAAPAVGGVEMRGLGAVAAIGGESFESGVDGDEGIVIGADDGCEDRHGRLKINAEAAILQVHHDVGTGLQFRQVEKIEIDVPGSSASSAENFG